MTFNLGGGNDNLTATGSVALINGGDGADVISYSPASANTDTAIINGDAGSDTITIGAYANGANTINGGAGDDIIKINGTGANVVNGDAGNDQITVESTAVGANVINGGDGSDTITISTATGSLTVNGGRGDDTIDLGNSTNGHTFVYASGDGNDNVTNYTKGTDKFKLMSGSIASDGVVVSSSNIIITVGSNKVTLTGADYTANEDFAYIDARGNNSTVKVTTATAGSGDLAEDLAESADLIYDDANFTTNDLSDLVETSRDTYSVGGLKQTTPGLAELTEQDGFLTYGIEHKTKK